MSDPLKMLSPEQRAAVRELAAAEGLTYAAFVRRCLLMRVAKKFQQNAIASSPLRPETPDAA